jgi:hypothetical protein
MTERLVVTMRAKVTTSSKNALAAVPIEQFRELRRFYCGRSHPKQSFNRQRSSARSSTLGMLLILALLGWSTYGHSRGTFPLITSDLNYAFHRLPTR